MDVDNRPPLNTSNSDNDNSMGPDGNSPEAASAFSTVSSTNLKRCSSAPMINEANRSPLPSNVTLLTHRASDGVANNARQCRFSATFNPAPSSPVAHRLGRVSQLRQEEHADANNMRELAHEREIHHTMQISQSWEDLSLMGDNDNNSNVVVGTRGNNGSPNGSSSNDTNSSNRMGPLHVATNCPNSSSPHSCNTPSPPPATGFRSLFHTNTNNNGNNSATSSSSPSSSSGFQSPTRISTRTLIRRSASPVLRPSSLGVKRKLEEAAERIGEFCAGGPPRIKRFQTDRTGGLLTTTCSSSGGGGVFSASSLAITPNSLSNSPKSSSPGLQNNLIQKDDEEMIDKPKPEVGHENEDSC